MARDPLRDFGASRRRRGTITAAKRGAARWQPGSDELSDARRGGWCWMEYTVSCAPASKADDGPGFRSRRPARDRSTGTPLAGAATAVPAHRPRGAAELRCRAGARGPDAGGTWPRARSNPDVIFPDFRGIHDLKPSSFCSHSPPSGGWGVMTGRTFQTAPAGCSTYCTRGSNISRP